MELDASLVSELDFAYRPSIVLLPTGLTSVIAGAPSGDYMTLAGFILSQLHELPKPGDHFVWAGWRFGMAGAST